MKRLACLFLICGTLSLAGCDDKDARQYAERLVEVLDTYQGQIDRKVSAEKDSYKELAAVYERARQRNIEQLLEQERIERAERLTTEMVAADHLPRNTEILDSLRAYAEHDFAATRDFLQIEADAQAQFLGDIEALEFESDTIDDLRSSLKQLAKPKGQLKRISEAADFAKSSKEELDKLMCQDLTAELEALNARLADLDKQRNEVAGGSAPDKAQQLEAITQEADGVRKKIAAADAAKKAKCA
ncbi:MAG TPA: hypothetical protein VFX96_01760 [Pyrinomonadaceae bacterium]|nr:hypothetical protein [Pyrinomonadaceae bacterium]